MYTIGQVSQLFGLPVSTLRYYDKEGLFPDIKRVSGIRQFDEKEIEAIRVIECLKKSGMEIKDIKQFMEWCAQGPQTYALRRELFLKQKASVEAEIERMNRVLDMLSYKCWYYEQATFFAILQKRRRQIQMQCIWQYPYFLQGYCETFQYRRQ